jgi:hypothetical protein
VTSARGGVGTQDDVFVRDDGVALRVVPGFRQRVLDAPRLSVQPKPEWTVAEYEAAMDDFIAIYFIVSPQICAIRYHRPETLEPFDYMFVFKGVREGRRPDGRPYVDSVRSALRGR